jgi:hypothetical protein
MLIRCVYTKYVVRKIRFTSVVYTFYIMFRLILNFYIQVFCVKIMWSTIFVRVINLTLLVYLLINPQQNHLI